MNRPHRAVSRLLLLLLFAAASVQAGTLEPYTATYSASMGMLSGTSTEQLSVDADGRYQLSQNLDAVVASIREDSHFTLRDDRILPSRYDYRFDALFKTKQQSEVFDWARKRVTHTYKGETSVQSLPPGTLDRITSRLQLRMDIAAGKTDLRYQVAEKGRIKPYEFAVVGEETLDTPLGPLQTIKLVRVREPDSERETLLWLAPAMNHLLVRLKQHEDGSDLVMELQETSLKPQ